MAEIKIVKQIAELKKAIHDMREALVTKGVDSNVKFRDFASAILSLTTEELQKKNYNFRQTIKSEKTVELNISGGKPPYRIELCDWSLKPVMRLENNYEESIAYIEVVGEKSIKFYSSHSMSWLAPKVIISDSGGNRAIRNIRLDFMPIPLKFEITGNYNVYDGTPKPIKVICTNYPELIQDRDFYIDYNIFNDGVQGPRTEPYNGYVYLVLNEELRMKYIYMIENERVEYIIKRRKD